MSAPSTWHAKKEFERHSKIALIEILEEFSLNKAEDILYNLKVDLRERRKNITRSTKNGLLETEDSPVESDQELKGVLGKRRRMDQTATKRKAVSDDE